MRFKTDWKPIETAPKDGTEIYIILHHIRLGVHVTKVSLLKVSWLKLSSFWGGEIREYWSTDGKNHIHYADDTYGVTKIVPKYWAHIKDVEIQDKIKR